MHIFKTFALALFAVLLADAATAQSSRTIDFSKGVRVVASDKVRIADKVHRRTEREIAELDPAIAQAEFLRLALFGHQELCEFQPQIGCTCYLDGFRTACSFVAICLEVELCVLE